MDHLQTIQQIFTSRFLTVPDYQRGYAWEKKHWDDLLDDIELLEVGSEHYTGTLVLHPNETMKITDEEGHVHSCYDVVDGQQRITTIVILLIAIRVELASNPALADGIKKTYIQTRDIEGQLRSKLQLNRDTHHYFEQNIIADKPSIEGCHIRSEELLRDAKKHMLKYVRSGVEKNNKDGMWLLNIYKKITNGLKLTVYEVPKASEVGVIFEVMNNRGKPLSEMEKVKNYLLYLVSKTNFENSEKLGEQINDSWRVIFENLMACNMSEYEDELLRSHWLTVFDYQTKNWHGVNSIKQKFNLKVYKDTTDKLIKELEFYVQSLREYSTAFCDLKAPSQSNSFKEYQSSPRIQNSIQKAAEKLNRLNALASFIPMLSAVRLICPGQSDLLLEFISLCEKYAFRVFKVAKRRSNAGQTSLFKIGYEIFHQVIIPRNALERIKAKILQYAPTEEFKNVLEKPKDWYSESGLKYFLYEYEEYLAKGVKVKLSWENLHKSLKEDTVEHVLPQTQTDYWNQNWSKKDIDIYLHDIGNLALTFDNSVYSNKTFLQKRGAPGKGPCYANSNLFMERQLASYSSWTKSELLKRRRGITDWAFKRWEVPPPTEKIELADLQDEEDNSE